MYSDKMKFWFTFLSNKIIPNKFQFQLFHDDIDDLESFMTAGTGDIEMLRAESSLPSIEELTKNVQSLIDKDNGVCHVNFFNFNFNFNFPFFFIFILDSTGN